MGSEHHNSAPIKLVKDNNKSELGIANLPATTKLVQGNEVTAVHENSVWQTPIS